MSYLPCLDCLPEFYAVPVLLQQLPKTLSPDPQGTYRKQALFSAAFFFFFCMLDQQGPNTEETKEDLNLNHAGACGCVDLDRRPGARLADSTGTDVFSNVVLRIQLTRLRQRRGGYLQSASQKPETRH